MADNVNAVYESPREQIPPNVLEGIDDEITQAWWLTFHYLLWDHSPTYSKWHKNKKKLSLTLTIVVVAVVNRVSA